MNTAEAIKQLASAADLSRHPVIELLGPQLQILEEELAGIGGPQPLDAMVADLFAAGGKRLRALATMTVSRALSVPDDVGRALALAVESTHGASLLHDDVIDEADERRSRPAARKRWCNTLSVLGGDHLLLSGLRTVWSLGCAPLTEAHIETLEVVLEAEVMQHTAREEWDTTTRNYLDIARGKSGALFAHGCASPAIYVGQDALAAGLSTYGMALGVAFQIVDDLRDVLGLDPTKPNGLDLTDGVLSLPLRMAARRDPVVLEGLRAAGAGRLAAGEVQGILARVRAGEAVERSSRLAHAYLARANAAVAAIGLGEPLTPLAAVCGWLTRSVLSFREVRAETAAAGE